MHTIINLLFSNIAKWLAHKYFFLILLTNSLNIFVEAGYMPMFSQSEAKKFNNYTPIFKYIYLLTLILLFLVENSF